MTAKTTIFPAKKIITMFPEQPFAKAVAVRDGRILAVGELNDISSWIKKSPFSPYEVDPIFEDKMLMPGLVDAHTHVELQGPDRAHQITPTGTARRLGVSWGIHNDPPGTPQLPWVAAWATVHRQTAESGTILGPGQRVSVQDVLRAMTIEHAFQLHLDREVGSIVFGKKADFCVLEADPLEIDPMELKDIPVWGTVFGGQPNPVRP